MLTSYASAQTILNQTTRALSSLSTESPQNISDMTNTNSVHTIWPTEGPRPPVAAEKYLTTFTPGSRMPCISGVDCFLNPVPLNYCCSSTAHTVCSLRWWQWQISHSKFLVIFKTISNALQHKWPDLTLDTRLYRQELRFISEINKWNNGPQTLVQTNVFLNGTYNLTKFVSFTKCRVLRISFKVQIDCYVFICWRLQSLQCEILFLFLGDVFVNEACPPNYIIIYANDHICWTRTWTGGIY